MSSTRVEWMILDYAILSVGAVTVPIFDSSSAEQMDWIMTDSGAAVLLVAETTRDGPDGGCVPAGSDCREALIIDQGAVADLGERGKELDRAEVLGRIEDLSTSTLATLIYTSGTTARPKGCMLTHGNLRTNVAQVSDALEGMIKEQDRTLLFLPLAHVLTRTAAFFCVEKRITIAFSSGLDHLQRELQLVAPTIIVGVPRVFEKFFNTARRTAAASGKARVFDRAAEVAIEYSRQRQQGTSRRLLSAEYFLHSKLVYPKLIDAFGGALRMAFCGGAPLGERLTSFFDGVGVRIFEGYGLTETSPILAINSCPELEGRHGRPAGEGDRDPGQVRTARSWPAGSQVFGGYWKNPEATAEVLTEDGWFSTGDEGELDKDGFLRITGRLKDIIVTAGGKNVSPAPLEDRLRAHELISQAVVVGDKRPFIGALIALDTQALGVWSSDHDLAPQDLRSDPNNAVIREQIQLAVDEANLSVSRAESIRKFLILPHDLEVATGELTPTLKVKREAVIQEYRDQIEQLYADGNDR